MQRWNRTRGRSGRPLGDLSESRMGACVFGMPDPIGRLVRIRSNPTEVLRRSVPGFGAPSASSYCDQRCRQS
jgi:hypothetical protein